MWKARSGGFDRWARTLICVAVLPVLVLVSPAQADNVILDDLIVDGSTCIGFDCVNGESFGFDTLRLKENNLRIKFDDTSNAASFPNNDWQLTANDSANGGVEKFSIDDVSGGRTPFTVEAGAPNHSLYVESSGELGLGTNNPVADVHIKEGDTPTVRMEQDSSSGWSPQTWDLAGNETNFFIRDVSNGSKLCFRIQPNAPTNTLTLRDGGKVGFGTWAPEERIHVKDENASTSAFVFVEDTANSAGFEFESNGNNWTIIATTNNNIGFREDGSSSNERLTLEGGGNVGVNRSNPNQPFQVGDDATNGNGAHVTTGGVWTNGSSREFKENIRQVSSEEARQVVMALNPVKYNYKLEPKEDYVGFIAEDVPELVATPSRKHLAPMDIVSVVTKVVQAQQETIDRQNETIAELAAEIQALKQEVASNR